MVNLWCPLKLTLKKKKKFKLSILDKDLF